MTYSEPADTLAAACGPDIRLNAALPDPEFAFSVPVSQDGWETRRRVNPASSEVVFSALAEISPGEHAATITDEPPHLNFSFTAPSMEFTERSLLAASGDLVPVPPVAFSSAFEVPFRASWANFLQDADAGDARGTRERDSQTMGEEPEETTDSVQFLRQDTILLRPGEYQFDLTVQYLVDEAEFTVARITEAGGLQISALRRRQRLLMMPLEFRIGVTPITQFFVNAPFGWANGETVFFGQDEFSSTGGIGDINLGAVQQLTRASEYLPNLLATVAVSAPTGNSDFADSLATPGSTLGQGFWTATLALTFTKTYDPVVLFGGFGYQWRTAGTFEAGLGRVRVEPGDQAFYRFGVGFAVNPKVTFSGAFRGAYVGDNYVDKMRIAGSGREPMQLRLATTIVRDKKSRRNTVKTVEPFVESGLTAGAVDAVLGVSCTY